MVWRLGTRAVLSAATVLALLGCTGSTEVRDGAGSPVDPANPGGATAPTGSGTAAAAAINDIDGIEIVVYEKRSHVADPQRVAYDRSPPFGGAHDAVWAACNGAVYETAVRNENMVHSLEHGAVWIAYDPDRVSGSDLAALRATVIGQPYLMLSPYPGLDRPLSLQSWGHQLKLDEVDDPRVEEFVRALRANPDTHPEPGATCDPTPGLFDVDAPPPFDPSPPGADAAPVDS